MDLDLVPILDGEFWMGSDHWSDYEKPLYWDLTPMGHFSSQDDSPYGCADMPGNVREWTHSLFKPYPYNANDGRENAAESGDRVVRGGAAYNYSYWHSLYIAHAHNTT